MGAFPEVRLELYKMPPPPLSYSKQILMSRRSLPSPSPFCCVPQSHRLHHAHGTGESRPPEPRLLEDPTRDSQAIRFLGAFDVTAHSLYDYFDYFPKAVRDLHCDHLPTPNLYDYTD
jgi:hypothetical protein